MTISRAQSESEPSDVARLPEGWTTLADLLCDPTAGQPARIVARGFAWEGRTTLLASREGVGKSTLAGAIVGAVSAGRDWLGEPTIAGAVVVLDIEEHVGDLVRRLMVHCAAAERVVLAHEQHEHPIHALHLAVAAVRPVLVVVDSLAAVGGRMNVTEAGSSAQWQPVMQALGDLARSTGAAVLILHHSRKTGDDYRDSTAVGAAVDVVALLRGPDKGQPSTFRRIEYRKRRVPADDFVLNFTGNGFELASSDLAPRDRVRAYIAEHPGCSLRQLRTVPGDNRSLDAAIAALIAEGVVEDRGNAGGRAYHLVGVGADSAARSSVGSNLPRFENSKGAAPPQHGEQQGPVLLPVKGRAAR